MLQNFTAKSAQENYPVNAYSVYGNIESYNSSDTISLITEVNRITNTTERKIEHTVSFSLDEDREKPAQTGLLKRLLTGAAILTGASMLATGCYYGYMALGRAGIGGRPEQTLLRPPLEGITELPRGFPSSLQMDSQEATTHSALPHETLRPPYSYYEGMYGNTTARNKALHSSSPVTKQTTVAVSTESSTAVPTTTTDFSISDTSQIKYHHESERKIYYNTLPKDMYYPLGKKLYMVLDDFCDSYIQHTVLQAYTAEPELKCKLLNFMNNMIEQYEFDDRFIRELHDDKETLSPDEHAEEIIARRKLTTLYLATEYIIDKKNVDLFHFHADAMLDNKDYTAEEMMKRKAYIMNYFITQNANC
jgi:hypothetical protein